MLAYKVTKKYGRGSEQFVANFAKQADAQAFILKALAEDLTMKIQSTYQLYDLDELMQVFDESAIDTTQSSQDSQQSSGNRQVFSPSPLQTRPMPSGMPHSSFKDIDTNDKGE